MAQNDQALLTRLKASEGDFVVIGGVCVVYHGAPLATFALDICCPFGEARSRFGSLKNVYLQTDLGKLDCLGEVAGVWTFDEVKRQSVVLKFSYGEFRFLNLDALIAAKKGRRPGSCALARMHQRKKRPAKRIVRKS
jgi:hypothetical protein